MKPRSGLRSVSKLLLGSVSALAALALLLLLSFALPVRVWRTGELDMPPLALTPGGPAVDIPRRVWIDTDAACGHGRTVDPDDCFAILLLAKTPGVEIAGISTVFGNAPLAVTDRTTRELVALLDGVEAPVHRGSATPFGDDGAAEAPAHPALRRALAEGPLTILALGPLTNIAAVLDGRPDLAGNLGRLVAVMGRRPGHLFHPAEGRGSGGILFGHGPVFTDFNFAQDPDAGAAVVAMRVPTTLVPYAAARELSLGRNDLDRIAAAGPAGAWVAERARGWLDFWNEDVGLPGFYPFDALAAAYVAEPELFGCPEAVARVAKDETQGPLWRLVFGSPALLVGPASAVPSAARASAPAVYCPEPRGGMHKRIVERLSSASPD
jgi:inosine-uridine nucleoside N-ribohydrolase